MTIDVKKKYIHTPILVNISDHDNPQNTASELFLYKFDLRQINFRLANRCYRIHTGYYTIAITDKGQ